MKLLKRLYLTHSPSHEEERLSKIVRLELKDIGITDFTLSDKRIFRIKPDTILLCAHMDQVKGKPISKVWIEKDNEIHGNGNLGADDKNGVWILLKLLKKYKNLSFIFSTREESGGYIKDILEDNKEILKTIKYGLVFDRKNGSNLIGTKNNYCVKEFEEDLLNLIKDFGYKSEHGILSDCNALAKYISCVNLSCGYYEPHTEKEYTKINELKNALKVGDVILSKLDKKYDKPELRKYYDNHIYNNYYFGNYFGNTNDDVFYVCSECHTLAKSGLMFRINGKLVCNRCLCKPKINKKEIVDLVDYKNDIVEIESFYWCSNCKKMYELSKLKDNLECPKCEDSCTFLYISERINGVNIKECVDKILIGKLLEQNDIQWCEVCEREVFVSDENRCINCGTEIYNENNDTPWESSYSTDTNSSLEEKLKLLKFKHCASCNIVFFQEENSCNICGNKLWNQDDLNYLVDKVLSYS